MYKRIKMQKRCICRKDVETMEDLKMSREGTKRERNVSPEDVFWIQEIKV